MSRILPVDDDIDHLKLFTIILDNKGYSVDAYTDSVTALSKFKRNYYDIILLDYRMPNPNGLELYALIREIDPTAKALLLMANHEQFTDGKQIEGQDCLRVITKSISNEKLLADVESTLNQPIASVSLENYDRSHQKLLLIVSEKGIKSLHKKPVLHNREHNTKEDFKQ